MFYQVIRIFFKGATKSNSVEYFDDSNSALQRYFNIIAADLANAEVTYNAAYLIDNGGTVIRRDVFDRRPQPEPNA